jgi:hypothetical protein
MSFMMEGIVLRLLETLAALGALSNVSDQADSDRG